MPNNNENFVYEVFKKADLEIEVKSEVCQKRLETRIISEKNVFS